MDFADEGTSGRERPDLYSHPETRVSKWKKWFVILPISSHPPGDLIAAPFGLHKNDGLVLLFAHYLFQQTDQPGTRKRVDCLKAFPPSSSSSSDGSLLLLVFLLHVVANIHYLEDVVIRTELQRSNVDLHVLLQEVLSQLANFLRPGGAPHQGLSVRLDPRQGREMWTFDIFHSNCDTFTADFVKYPSWWTGRYIFIAFQSEHGASVEVCDGTRHVIHSGFNLPGSDPQSFGSVAQIPCPACGQPRPAPGRCNDAN